MGEDLLTVVMGNQNLKGFGSHGKTIFAGGMIGNMGVFCGVFHYKYVLVMEQFRWLHIEINSGMKMSHKSSHSCLNLKFLDAKFISVTTEEGAEHIQDIRNSKAQRLPSIMKSLDDPSDICMTNANPRNNQTALLSDFPLETDLLAQLSLLRKDSHVPKEPPSDYSLLRQKSQKEQIQKYLRLISKIKAENKEIHNQILSIFRSKKLIYKDAEVKPVRFIESQGEKKDKVRLQRLEGRFQNIYENLSSSSSPYKAESEEVRKLLLNNNMHRNLQMFFAVRNKRVPEFLKGLR